MNKILERTLQKEEKIDVNCNMCGRPVEKNDFGYFEDHITVAKTWGYGTPIDGETHVFEFCFDCYNELTDRFAIPPRVLAEIES